MGALPSEVAAPPHELGRQKPSHLLHILLVALCTGLLDALGMGFHGVFDLAVDHLKQCLLAVPQINSTITTGGMFHISNYEPRTGRQ